MYALLVLTATGLVILLLSLYRTRFVRGLHWPEHLDNRQMSRLCKRYFALHDIQISIEKGALFDLRIEGGQFAGAVGPFLAGCRNRGQLTGETQIKDMRDACTQTHRGASPIIISSTQYPEYVIDAGRRHHVPIIAVLDLPEFVSALQEAKSPDWGGYSGLCESVAMALLPRHSPTPSSAH